MARRVGEALETPVALLKPLGELRKHRQPAPEVGPPSRSRRKPLTPIPARTGRESPPGSGAGTPGRDDGSGGGGVVKHADRNRASKRLGRGGASKGRVGPDGKTGPTNAGSKSKLPVPGPDGSLPGRRHLKGKPPGMEAALAKAGSSSGANPVAHGYRLERLRRERQKALVNGDTRRAARLGVREQRIEGEQARHEMVALGMIDPEMEAVEVVSIAGMAKPGPPPPSSSSRSGSVSQTGQLTRPGRGAQSGQAATKSSAGAPRIPNVDRRPGGEQRVPQRSTVMDDAREVAARRKRQLGWGPEQPGSGRTP